MTPEQILTWVDATLIPTEPCATLVPTLTDITRALAWHAQLQTYLLIGLAVVTVAGFWAIGRDMRALGRLANAIATRLDRGP